MTDHNDMPGHLARRFQQIAVAIFHAEVEEAGYDLTPGSVCGAHRLETHPGIDQATLAGLIAYDRTTITGVVDRLVQKGLVVRQAAARTAAPTRCRSPMRDGGPRGIEPAVEAAQRIMLRGLTATRPRIHAAVAQGHRRRQRTKPGAAAGAFGQDRTEGITRRNASIACPARVLPRTRDAVSQRAATVC